MRFTFPPYDLVGKGAVEIGTAIVPVGVVAKAGKLGKIAKTAGSTVKKTTAAAARGAVDAGKKAAGILGAWTPALSRLKVAVKQRCQAAVDRVRKKRNLIVANPKSQFGKLRLAYEYYKGLGWPKGRIRSHLDGIDFSKPVKLVKLPKGKLTSQYQAPGGKKGNYFAEPHAKATELGINPNVEIDGILVKKIKPSIQQIMK